MPRVSVLLPVRDAAPWLASSLSSLWRQSFRDFEVIAVDDGSRDDSGAMLDRIAARESRLRVFHTPAQGLPHALNRAFREARGALIARHDADDLSHRERFALQVALLAGSSRVDVVGARLRMFPAHHTGPGMRRWRAWHNALLTHEDMMREALIDSVLAHGTAMIRRASLESVGGWQERGWAEDMDLWLRLMAGGHRFAKIDRTLYAWRQHQGSATRNDPRYRRERMDDLRLDALGRRPLAQARTATVVGTGLSHERWTRLLRERGWRVMPLRHGRPGSVAGALDLPLVLVFGSPVARSRWRTALTARGLTEGREFVFVA